MTGTFRRDVVALLQPDVGALAAEDLSAAVNSSLDFVDKALARAPEHIRLAEKALRLCLWFWTRPCGGLPKQARGIRWRWVLLFRSLPGPFGMLFRLYSSLSAFAFFEHEAVAKIFDVMSTTDRQQAYRKTYKAND